MLNFTWFLNGFIDTNIKRFVIGGFYRTVKNQVTNVSALKVKKKLPTIPSMLIRSITKDNPL